VSDMDVPGPARSAEATSCTGEVGQLPGIPVVRSPVVPPGHMYLAGAVIGAVLYWPAPRPWWRRALAWCARWALESLAAAGSVWAGQPAAGRVFRSAVDST
jgi:hypothetical protein